MNLIIVESPTKARTLSKFLGKGYTVEASIGHVRDLPKSELGVDIDHEFSPKYIIPREKQKRVKELKEIAAKAKHIILATDPDREGEAIAWHVATMLRTPSGKGKKVKDGVAASFDRIVFHEITESAIKHALSEPRSIDMQLVDAQQARRILDRLFGYKLSPLLWKKLSKRWLSAGRVQSVAVRLIVEREREVEKFAAVDYYTIDATFAGGKEQFVAELTARFAEAYETSQTIQLFDGKYTTKSTTIQTQEAATTIITDFRAPFTVASLDKKEVKRHPHPPYTTSTLQQDAGRKLYFSSKKTMQLAQKLYEEGYITYHRTDSFNLSEKFIGEAREYIKTVYGPDIVPAEARTYQTKSKVAQEAHEAIRPTNVQLLLGKAETHEELNRDHIRLYELIWKRAVASQAREAIFDSTTILITDGNGYTFTKQGSVIKFEGFLKITGRDTEEIILPKLAVGDELRLVEATSVHHSTAPPPRYTEATLVKTLEEKGIGRPSTYAPIISTIQERQYVVRDQKKLLPTELGKVVVDFLVQYFPDILSLPFTATLEDSLDEIANGTQQWVPIVGTFYRPFEKLLLDAYDIADKVKMPEEEVGEACPTCSNPLVIRMGRYGKFIACSTFPQCKYTRQYAEKIDQKCPRCGADIVVKKTRRGKTFYGCGNYPTCNFAAWKKEDIK